MELARELWLALPEFGRAGQQSSGGQRPRADVTWHGRHAWYRRGIATPAIGLSRTALQLDSDLGSREQGPRVPQGQQPEARKGT